ncbi:MAG TPA: hypothetical protein P5532_09675, partial [Planctomycetota bacterium]|nr:hypothetical protein [Planctomycetota bacterium]
AYAADQHRLGRARERREADQEGKRGERMGLACQRLQLDYLTYAQQHKYFAAILMPLYAQNIALRSRCVSDAWAIDYA